MYIFRINTLINIEKHTHTLHCFESYVLEGKASSVISLDGIGIGIGELGMVRGWGIWLGLGVDRGTLVGDFSDVAVHMVSSVLHMLDPTIREGYRVRSRDDTVGIARLSGVEVGFGVVVGDTVGVGVRLWGLFDVDNRGRSIGRGSVDNRGSMNHRGSMVCRSRGMMYHWSHWAIGWSGMVDSMRHRVVNSMGNRMMHSVWHWVVDGMGHRVGNMVGSMVGNWVGNKTMVSNRVRKVGNLLDQGTGRSCHQQRGEDESLEKSVVSDLSFSEFHPIFKITSLHTISLCTFILFLEEVLKLTGVVMDEVLLYRCKPFKAPRSPLYLLCSLLRNQF